MSNPDHTHVYTRSGPVFGERTGRLNVFKGIPYARPPVGDQRFRPPAPAPVWNEPRDATRFGAAPIQSAIPIIGAIGPTSEDCLTLNVWAPAQHGSYSVLVWIYGGANILGTASQALYDGAKFAEKGVVFVSVNYRLGVLGFLELGSIAPELAGSSLNGLRDLVAALTWVKDNIAAFGGNPNRVSIVGQSAGGKNVCSLMAIPQARELFHRAGVISGGGHTTYASIEDSAPFTRTVLESVQPMFPTAADLVRLPAEVLLSAQEQAFARHPGGFPFRPTVDGQFLPRRPIDAIREGVSSHVDLLIGTCRDEAAMLMSPTDAELPLQSRHLANLDLARMRAIETQYDLLFPDLSQADRRLRALTAEEYWMPCVTFAEAHANAGGTTRMYRFDAPSGLGPLAGYAPHGADLSSHFDTEYEPGFRLPLLPGEPSLRRRVHGLWADWARDGRVVIEDGPAWPLYDATSRKTMLINATCQVVADPEADERNLWRDF